MNYNAVISVEDITDESGAYEEPVSIEEFKDYARIDGFVDVDDSPSTEFDFDDKLISEIIKASREVFEENCGLSLIRKTLQAVLVNLCGRIEIPYGPVLSVTSLVNCEGDAITDYRTTGNTWKFLVSPCQKDLTITYEAGYDEIPKAMKLDLLRLALYMYENRGEDATISGFASQLTSKWSRKTFIF